MNYNDEIRQHTMMDGLTPRATKIMDLTIQGMANVDIAKQLEIDPQYVSTITHAPNFQHQLAIRRAQVEEKIADGVVHQEQEAISALKQHARAAADKIVNLMESAQSEGLQLKAAQDVLDRVGPRKQQSAVNQSIVMISETDAAVLRESLLLDGEAA